MPPVPLAIPGHIAINNVPGGGGFPPPTDEDDPCPELQDVINNIKNQCLKAMVDIAIQKDIKFDLNNSMKSIFDQNTDFNLNFIDAAPNSFSKPTVDGDTHIDHSGSTKLANGRIMLQSMDLSIRMNTNLATGSKEYVAATIMHEALHAYLDFSQTIINQHIDIATNYINSMQQQLLNMFPSTLTPDDAFALAWGGLKDDAVTLYSRLSTAQKDNITIANKNFKSGAMGQPCTP